jgi:steroid Delta-isomerase
MKDSPVHLAGKRSREAAVARDKAAWLALFADDAVIEDPIGPSHFDPEGKGHRGKDAIAKFFDMAIAPSELTFNFEKTFQCGNEEANVGSIVIRAAGYEVDRRGCVYIPGRRRGQDRSAARVLGTRQGHRERPRDLTADQPN